MLLFPNEFYSIIKINLLSFIMNMIYIFDVNGNKLYDELAYNSLYANLAV